MPNLLLHQGASAVSRDALAITPTPMGTASWYPIPHLDLLQQVESSLDRQGMTVTNAAHGLTHDGSRYFGLLEVRCSVAGADWTPVVGVRNSHDKRFPAGICCGAQVLVCDNLCFSGSIVVARKHTRFLERDLPFMVWNAVQALQMGWQRTECRIQAYKHAQLDDRNAHHLTIQALDSGVISSSHIGQVLSEYRQPRHEAFRPRTVWSLHNAFTEVMKGDNVQVLPARTEALFDVCDRFAGVN